MSIPVRSSSRHGVGGRGAAPYLLLTPLIWLAIAAGATHPASRAPFRVVAYLKQYDQPFGLAEAARGLYYSVAGSATQVVFSITPDGSQSVLATFPNGANIQSKLIGGANGRYYSALQVGNRPAAVFSVGPQSGQVVYPAQKLVPALTQGLPDGLLLGVATALQADPSYLVRCDLEGRLTPIYRFPPGEKLPAAATYATDGNYYGIATRSDASGYVYRVTPGGSLTRLVTFPRDTFPGSYPAPLLQAGDGNLYGATPGGGAGMSGTIYSLTLDGRHKVLYAFPRGPDSMPTELIEASDGNLYGAAHGRGGGHSVLFRLTKSGQYAAIYAMKSLTDDGECQCELTQGSDGMIYGTAAGGGVSGGGDVFVLDLGLAKPAPQPLSFQPKSGPAGTKVLIWGRGMLAASVQFHGVEAKAVSSKTSTYVWATVPPGATSGPIRVTTANGRVATKGSFVVRESLLPSPQAGQR